MYIITKAGEVIDFETVFERKDSLFDVTPEHQGRFERVDYETSVYNNGITYKKYCNVYLPYGYDECPDKKYNVMYYQHGNTCDPELFTEEKAKASLDALFDEPDIEPCIMVFTTYYMDVTENVEERKKTGFVPAGDGSWKDLPANFHMEVAQDIIPAIELKYRTYLTGSSREEIIASRDHRGFSGYSRGAACTWYMLHYEFELFRYYAPMSCMTTADLDIFTEAPQAVVEEYLTAPMKAHPEMKFFIYGTNGHPHDVSRMTDQMKFMVHHPLISFGQDPEKNNFYFGISDLTHTDLYAPYYFYNSLKVLFK